MPASLDDYVNEFLRRHRQELENLSSMELLSLIVNLNKLQGKLFDLLLIKMVQEAKKYRDVRGYSGPSRGDRVNPP